MSLLDCARCGHAKSYHDKDGRKTKVIKNCRLCDCQKWWGSKCVKCGGWRYSEVPGLCQDCYKAGAAKRREANHPSSTIAP